MIKVSSGVKVAGAEAQATIKTTTVMTKITVPARETAIVVEGFLEWTKTMNVVVHLSLDAPARAQDAAAVSPTTTIMTPITILTTARAPIIAAVREAPRAAKEIVGTRAETMTSTVATTE